MKVSILVALAVMAPWVLSEEPSEAQVLAKKLHSPDKEIRRHAIEQAANLGAQARPAGDALLDVILEDNNDDISSKAKGVAEVVLDLKSSDLDTMLAQRSQLNEAYAKVACNKIFSAQISFWNTDAAQEFAQSLNGDTGLFSESTTRKRPNFIPRVLAQAEGEPKQGLVFRGYRFKLLKEQGDRAPGGAKSYVADGKLVYGYALIAYPCVYRRSGTSTYILDYSGKIRYKDLGSETDSIVKSMTKFNPDFTWDVYVEPKEKLKNAEKKDELKIEDI